MFNDTKVVIYPNKVILYNYTSINEITDEVIIIDKWKVFGKQLKIIELDSYYILIKGLIEGVNFV